MKPAIRFGTVNIMGCMRTINHNVMRFGVSTAEAVRSVPIAIELPIDNRSKSTKIISSHIIFL
jgi:hypothetical protein